MSRPGLLAGRLSLLFALPLMWIGFSQAEQPKSESNQLRLSGMTPEQAAAEFERLRFQHADMTYEQLETELYETRDYVSELPFDPTEARHFELVKHRLRMSDEEVSLLKKNGFVSIDQKRNINFAAAYQQIYTSDLPVFISTDSILHALHSSYDALLKELELSYFTWTVEEVLADAHAALADAHKAEANERLAMSVRDVDLYLSVARTLLDGPKRPRELSLFDQQDDVDRLINLVHSNILQSPTGGRPTEIYGGRRYVDYSQFKPRGHYAESDALKNYFRTMMWLGRADCGWNVLPTDHIRGVDSDSRRELTNAMLLTRLLKKTGGDKRLRAMDDMLKFLVGQSDNLNIFALDALMNEQKVSDAVLADDKTLENMQSAIRDTGFGQLIRSQVVLRPEDGRKAETPVMWQAFGQRFVIDSFVISKVVHDEIHFLGTVEQRMKPTGLDAWAALGNNEAIPLLAKELKQWNYSANLLASHEFVEQMSDDYWRASLSNTWLDGLRELDRDMTGERNAPHAMKTRTWQKKQLQTQLASWSELRHDNLLYAKQSYGVPGCAYPEGYVEPYPAFYAKLRALAENGQRLMKLVDPNVQGDERKAELAKIKDRQSRFFAEMTMSMKTLEAIARRHLAAQPLTEDQESFLQTTFARKGWIKFGSAAKPAYDGWYCRLYYDKYRNDPKRSPLEWKPTIADVHTDPHFREVLEVGVGAVNLMVIAIDNEDDRAVFVGPVYSYYEFWQPASERLTDQKWLYMLNDGNAPARPDWVQSFQANSVDRPPESPTVTAARDRGELRISVNDKSSSEAIRLGADDRSMHVLGSYRNLHSLDVSDSGISDEGLSALKSLHDLRSLNVSKTAITDDGVKHVARHRFLQSLDLSETKISDAALPDLEKLLDLEILNLRNTQVSKQGVGRLRKTLRHTEISH